MFVESGTLGFSAIPSVRRAAGRARPHARNVAEGLARQAVELTIAFAAERSSSDMHFARYVRLVDRLDQRAIAAYWKEAGGIRGLTQDVSA